MSNISVKNQTQTYLQKIQDSKPAQFAKDNKLVTAGTVTGAAIIGKHVMDKSSLVKTAIQKGAVPTLGAAAIGFGGLMIHDAIQNQDKTGLEKLKTAADGVALGVIGTEAIGRGLNVSKLQPITQSVNFLVRNKEAVGGIAMTGAALTGVAFAVKNMTENGINTGNAAALAASGTLAGGFTLATASTIAAHNDKVMNIAEKSAGALVGTTLGVASYSLAKETASAISEGNASRAVGFGLGAAATGVASVHLIGNATGIPALSNIGGKLIGKNPVLTGAVALTAIGVGSYLLYDQTSK